MYTLVTVHTPSYSTLFIEIRMKARLGKGHYLSIKHSRTKRARRHSGFSLLSIKCLIQKPNHHPKNAPAKKPKQTQNGSKLSKYRTHVKSGRVVFSKHRTCEIKRLIVPSHAQPNVSHWWR